MQVRGALGGAVLTKGVITLMLTSQAAYGWTPSPDDMLTARRWVSTAFEGRAEPAAPAPGLEVLRNVGRIQKNARYGRPMTIAGVPHGRGLFCRAPSEVRVRLPGPARTFTAVIGLDDALQWDVRDYPSGPIWPEVVCTVSVGGRTLFKSEVVKIGMAGLPVTVELNGATEFTMSLAGSRRSAQPLDYLMTEDQKKAVKQTEAPEVHDWAEVDLADAAVTLNDGRQVYLDDLPTAGSMARPEVGEAPFSFMYGGKRSAELLPRWRIQRGREQLDASRTRWTVTYTDERTGLVARCVAVEYADYPTVEWTLYLKNTAKRSTPLLRDIRALDIPVRRGPDGEFILHHSLGSSCRADDYRPMETVLAPRTSKRFAPVTGYSSDPDMPYFNVETGAGEGMIVVVGWPGQWSAEFARDESDGLRIRAGQETTNLRLRPGEEIRTPLIVLQFWQGDYTRSQNTWRRWMVAHNLPRPDGKPIEPILVAGNWSPLAYTGVTEQNQKEFIDRYREEAIPISWWWIDYGWAEGTWQPAKARFPEGFRPVTDYTHARGIKTLVWFAPEHSPNGGDPKWLLKAIADEPLTRGAEISALDLGNPDAWRWMVDTVDDVITKGNLDCYRHDTSWGPLPVWRKRDSRDRQGMTEIRYVEGFLAFYDELLRRHPNLMIDNCCRGGRRNDLETMRRSVPLWRSDYAGHAASQQSQTYGVSLWLPFHGIGMAETNSYAFRSYMTPSMHLVYDMRNRGIDYAAVRKLTGEWRQMAPSYLGDYYPLTPYSMEPGVWMAWQFDTPETGKGFVQVFRRDGSPRDAATADTMRFHLRGLDPEAEYIVTDVDAEAPTRATGRELMEKGIRVEAATPPQAFVFTYRRAPGK